MEDKIFYSVINREDREDAKVWVDLISEWRLLIVDCWFFWKNEPLRHESRKGAKDWVDFRMTNVDF